MTTTTTDATTPYPAPDTAAAVTRALAAARDRPDPVDDAHRTAEKYARMSQNFRRSAWKHLLEDVDLPQASNKAWGMVAETIKAISAHHGGIIHTHRSLWQVVRELSRLAGDAGDTQTRDWISSSFMVARGLHTNYYEDEAPADVVRASLMLCEELSQRLYRLFWPEGAPPPSNPSPQ